MFDPTQTLLVAVITTLTILLTIIGIQVVQILKEVKKSVEKTNHLLDKADRVVDCVAVPIEGASDFFKGLKNGVNVLGLLSRFLKTKEKIKKDQGNG